MILFLNNSCSYITDHSPVNNVSSPACHAGDPGSSPSLAREDTLCPIQILTTFYLQRHACIACNIL